MIRFIPGLAGAVAAYGTLMFINWIQNSWIHAVIFFGVYLFVSFGIDKAMAEYGKSGSGKS